MLVLSTLCRADCSKKVTVSYLQNTRSERKENVIVTFCSGTLAATIGDSTANSDSVKVFEHTAVFPMHLLNSNVCDWDLETSGIRQHRKGKERGWVHLRARRVYHAAGYSKKMAVISEMIKLRLPHIDLQSIASTQNGNVR